MAKRKAEDDNADEAGRTLYIGGIPYIETEASIKKWFAEWCGPVESIEMLTFPHEPEKFRGIALVTFATSAGRDAAFGYHHAEWDGNFLTVKQYDATRRKGPSRPAVKTDAQAENEAPEKPAEVEVPTEGPFEAFIGNLDWSVDEDALWNWLKEALPRRCDIVNVRVTETPTRKFGFAEFGSGKDLAASVPKLDQRELAGRPAKVMVSASKGKKAGKEAAKPEGDGCSVIVRCLPSGAATAETIRRLFTGHKLKDVYVPRTAETFGFVRFASAADAKAALVVDGAKVDGYPIKVMIAAKGRN